MLPINYLAVLASAVLMMVLGYLWYGPLFGKQWAALMGWSSEDMKAKMSKGAGKSYALMALGALLMAFILDHALIYATSYEQWAPLSAGLFVGFANWLGFVVPVSLSTVLWDGKPWKLWFINAGYYLVGLLLMGVLLAMWT